MAVDTVSNQNAQSTHASQARSAKDSYDEKERELNVKHRQEMAELQRKHQKSVESLKSQYDQALGNLRESERRTMTEREKSHMKEVQDIQDINRRRYVQAKSDDDQRFNTTKDSLEGELDRAREKE